MLIFIRYILPLFFILLVVWGISYTLRRIRYGKSTPTIEQTQVSPRQIVFRLFAAGILIATLLATYLKNS